MCRTVMTTEECLLNPNRNPSLNKGQIEQFLKDYLGISKVSSQLIYTAVTPALSYVAWHSALLPWLTLGWLL